jgi:hypothetical protein
VTGIKTKTLMCSPLRANRGGGRVVAVVNLINKKDDQPFDENDEVVLQQMSNNFIDEMAGEFTELLHLNDSISAFATPILPSAGSRRPSFSNHEGHTTGTTSYKNLVDSTKKYLEERKESSDAKGFSQGNHEHVEKEKARRERRKSFGEKLNQEIAENPELLHVRKG